MINRVATQDDMACFERYLLCDFTQHSTKKTFIINFESFKLPHNEILSNNQATRLTLFGKTALVPVMTNQEVNLYTGNGNAFDSMTPQQVVAFNQVREEYSIKRIIYAAGNTLSITNGSAGKEYTCKIPNEFAWDKAAWFSLVKKCNQSLMEVDASGRISTDLLISHLHDVFGTLEFVETPECTCESIQRTVGGTFG